MDVSQAEEIQITKYKIISEDFMISALPEWKLK